MSLVSSQSLNHFPKSQNVLTLLLQPVRNWMDSIKVTDAQFARLVCTWIPAQCPFERDVTLFGRTLFHIPPMCKLNPLYEQFIGLRFRALCHLVDECGEDITPYC